MAISKHDKKKLRDEMLECVRRCIALGYRPSYFIRDLTELDPVEVIHKYVLAPAPTDGFTKLWQLNHRS